MTEKAYNELVQAIHSYPIKPDEFETTLVGIVKAFWLKWPRGVYVHLDREILKEAWLRWCDGKDEGQIALKSPEDLRKALDHVLKDIGRHPSKPYSKRWHFRVWDKKRKCFADLFPEKHRICQEETWHDGLLYRNTFEWQIVQSQDDPEPVLIADCRDLGVRAPADRYVIIGAGEK